MKFQTTNVKTFRQDFQSAIAKLEKQYDCKINLGNIRFNANELRSKLTATTTTGIIKSHTVSETYSIGQDVKIAHRKCIGETYTIVKKLRKNWVLLNHTTNTRVRVNPSLITKL
tara:strand:+ start:5257 stop:5598 length:342 start_codon:yes stop_codon:yes gene_type:complete